MFICNHCPYVQAVLDRIVRDARELQAAGIGVVAISSNDVTAYPEDSFEQMQRLWRDKALPFPYLYDESQAVARAYGAVCTPDFFGYDRELLLQYRGRIDASGRQPAPRRCKARTARRHAADRDNRARPGRADAEHRLFDQVEVIRARSPR